MPVDQTGQLADACTALRRLAGWTTCCATCRTKVVAAVHVSNLLGEVLDVPALVREVRAASPAHTVVDGVAYAPHLPVDVAAWGVDW